MKSFLQKSRADLSVIELKRAVRPSHRLQVGAKGVRGKEEDVTRPRKKMVVIDHSKALLMLKIGGAS